MLNTRQDKIKYIKQSFAQGAKLGLEISPSINPMIGPSEGYDVKYLDACTTSELRERAVKSGRDPDGIPIVDYVFDFSKSIADCVDGQQFDFVLSSHVIEHVPDLISHFNQVHEILRCGGVYAFLAPDKDLCFDVVKPDTTFGQLVEAYIEKRKMAPLNAIIDEYYYAKCRGGSGAWAENNCEPLRAKYPHSRKLIEGVLSNPLIVNEWHGHIWRFTPETFKSLFLDLKSFGLVQFELRDVVPTSFMEFIVILKT